MSFERSTAFISALLFGLAMSLCSVQLYQPVLEAKKVENVSNKKLISHAAKLDHLVQKELVYSLSPKQALDDPFARISDDFSIPKKLSKRVEFWFEIYTHFNKNQQVIHHSKYPWIVYEVVDTSIFLKDKGPLWLKIKKGQDYVSKRKKIFRRTLTKLAKRRSFKSLTKFERDLYNKLKEVPGKRKTVFMQATKFLRAQLGQKEFFLSGLQNSNKYLHLMEEVFKKEKLPTELTRIPFVESSFNEKAQSRVGASGVWQIMPRVGKKFSIINKYIDERNSPLKASKVAALLLKQNYQILKSWPLAVTAYNNGVGNIKKAIRRARSRQLNTIIAKNHKGAFKFASSNFYASFLAALYAEKYHQEIFPYLALEKAEAMHKVSYKLKNSWRPKTLAKKADIDLKTLLAYNLDLKKSIRKNRLLPRGFTLLLPPDKAKELKAKLF